MYAYIGEIRGEGLGDVQGDRVYREWPVLMGRETEEGGEMVSSRWPEEGRGDVFSDRLYGEWPRMWGYEVSEE